MSPPAVDLPALVVLDMAGTTVRDGGQVPAAFAAALAEHGIEVTPPQVTAVRGACKREAIAGLVTAHERRGAGNLAAAVYSAFRSQLARRYAAGVEAVPGAEETIAWLREHDVRVGLNTGFDRDITDLLLGALGWRDAVDVVVCGKDVARGRPAPDMIFRVMELAGIQDVGEVANVGDTVLDLEAGSNAAVACNVGVLSGAHARSLLAARPHTHLIGSVAELPGLWPGAEPPTRAQMALS